VTLNIFLQPFSKSPSNVTHSQKVSRALLFPKAGNSLVEYALPLAIVGIAILVGVTSLGPNFKEALPGFSNGSFGTGSDSKTIRLQPMGSNPFNKTVQLRLASGKIIELENYPTDIKALVETLGPNGTTDLLTNALMQLAQKLLDKGEITQDQANQLKSLANSGHGLASYQAIFEDAAAKAGTDSKLFAQLVKSVRDYETANLKEAKDMDPSVHSLFDIQEFTPTWQYDANGNIMKDSAGNFVSSSIKATSKYSPGVADFVNAFAQAQKSGALKDPTVLNLVSQLSSNIYLLGHSSTSTATKIATPEFQTNPTQFNQKVAEPIHKDSANICAAGGGKDSGIYCPSNKNGHA
jgi:hypothetical protein